MEHQKATSANTTVRQWVAHYSDDLYRWALHKTGDKETAEDLVQETFLAAFKSLDEFQDRSQPKTWLFSILNHKIMDHYRNRMRRATINQSHPGSSSENGDLLENFFDNHGAWKPEADPSAWQELEGHLLDNPEFTEALKDCLKRLPDQWNSVVRLKYLAEKEAAVICQELDISPSNYWQIMHRAKLQLRLCIEKNWFAL